MPFVTRRQAIIALPLACNALAFRAQTPKASSRKRNALLYGGSASEVEELEKPIWTTIQRLGGWVTRIYLWNAPLATETLAC